MKEANFSHLIKQLQQLTEKLPRVMEQALLETAVRGAQLARENMHFSHSSQGGLKSPTKTYGELTGPHSARLIANTFYASWVEFGNGPPGGRIYPTHANALRFPVNGQYLYRKWVSTSKPKPFMAPTARQLMTILPHNIANAWALLISEL